MRVERPRPRHPRRAPARRPRRKPPLRPNHPSKKGALAPPRRPPRSPLRPRLPPKQRILPTSLNASPSTTSRSWRFPATTWRGSSPAACSFWTREGRRSSRKATSPARTRLRALLVDLADEVPTAVVAEAADGLAAIDAIAGHRVDVVL